VLCGPGNRDGLFFRRDVAWRIRWLLAASGNRRSPILDGSNKAVASPWQGLDEARFPSRVPERVPQPIHGRVETVIKIYECLRWPERLPQLFPAHQLPLPIQQ
jgi:hypothetical protein